MDPLDSVAPSVALDRLLRMIGSVGTETLQRPTPRELAGRVLAEPLVLDRDSPACDVSAMDGFAVRMAEIAAGPLPVGGECRIGTAPPRLAAGIALRIYTGSPIPAGADTVVPLELVKETDGTVLLHAVDSLTAGANLRRQGENARCGAQVIPVGTMISPAAMTALAAVGPPTVAVYRRLRLAILTTGDELVSGPTISHGTTLTRWQLRDSNGPALEALFGTASWIGTVTRGHVLDTLAGLSDAIRAASAEADALVLTGGVSKGAYDHVPAAVLAAGGEGVFHRLNARPGRPTFAAVIDGKPIIGLPGNPLAVLTSGRRIVTPALRQRAGFSACDPPSPTVELVEWSGKSLPLTWWRPVTLIGPGHATLADLRGSGDTCGPASSDGFIEAPPNSDKAGIYGYYSWMI
ncbi:molybdopterin molybdotransferase MoeA [Botrimarina hoheduenensis]|uniref:Molybdopterin molybdenumtransferase n=1 Tax=Botrimarina hoheduenensis TaxID=2528000 RepID=A0A5C5VTG8_9BACT|nr:molybdopterin molybdotransferase MoeA [Botrimarina hoheduenensis]TWT41427.1 Molybdopterin molybdenumtransferase [Botrimarina hoheduenensis]